MPGLFSRLRGEPQRDAPADADCLECRVIGTATCFGVAAYSWSQRVPGNRRWLACFSAVWVVLGAGRAAL